MEVIWKLLTGAMAAQQAETTQQYLQLIINNQMAIVNLERLLLAEVFAVGILLVWMLWQHDRTIEAKLDAIRAEIKSAGEKPRTESE